MVLHGTDSACPPASTGFAHMFHPGKLTLGIFFPIESFAGDMPSMQRQEALARRAEALGFSALWFRDVPLRDPSFGDVGQIFDPWVYLAWIAAHTQTITLATGAVVLPLRHPIHVAKAAASLDQLSGGRLVLGVATGDRLIEFPAFGVDPATRGSRFEDAITVIRKVLTTEFPVFESRFGSVIAGDVIPKPLGALPILVVGSATQTLDWIARKSDGWITYPRPVEQQCALALTWKASVARAGFGFKPFAQSLYVDLSSSPGDLPQPIHLGFRSGRNALVEHLIALRRFGVNHVALNLKYGRRPAAEVLEEIGQEVLPALNSEDTSLQSMETSCV